MSFTVKAEDYTRISQALREASDGGLRKSLTAEMSKVAQPYGRFILAKGASQLPKHGGLSYLIAGGRVGVQVSTLRATISLPGHDTKSIDKGVVRHPVFGDKKVWRQQAVPVGVFSTPFRQETAPIAAALRRAAETVIDQIARGV